MAQRGCDACPNVDATPRRQITTADGATRYYHLTCEPDTSNDTDGLHPSLKQLVHASELATGPDGQGYDLGSVGELRSNGVGYTVDEMTLGGRPIREVSDELIAAGD